MSRDRRWWGVPRSLAGFSLWRLSNPFDTGDSEAAVSKCTEPSRRMSEVRESTPNLESDPGREKIPQRRADRSRSRSSSFSFKSKKSTERSSPEVDPVEVKPKKDTLPNIRFTFFSEKDRGDEFIVVDPSALDVRDTSLSPTRRRSVINCVLESNITESESEQSTSEEDARVKRAHESEVDKTCVKHVSSVVMNMKPVDYSNINLAVEHVFKEHDYEVLKDPPYSLPALCFPVYATVDKSNQQKGSTLDSASSKEFQEALPFPTDKSSTIDSTSSKDFSEALPAIPQPDWEEESTSSERNGDYAELTSPETAVTAEKQPTEEVKAGMEYCVHRAELKPSLRRVTLLRCKKTVRGSPAIGRVRLKLGKAWKKVRCWWIEERVRLNEVILKRDSVHERSVESDALDTRSLSEENVYVGVRSLGELEEKVKSVEDVRSACATLPARYLRRQTRGRSPTPGLSRSSSIAAFRRSKFFPEVQYLL